MTENKNNIAIGKKGMNRDAHPSNLSEAEYTFALNSNYENETGDSYPMLQNEHSNILCSIFKTGYKVVGFKHDLNSERTYYFLTNPSTGVSEIGYISSIQNYQTVEDLESSCDCDIINILSNPLEEQEQVPTSTYTTIISDECNQCLNLSVDYPIKKGNIQLKDEKCGKRLYWTDDNNEPRFIDLSNLEQYKFVGQVTCDETETPTCLDCEKLKIFPNAERPVLKPQAIQNGGNLKAGTYEFLLAYCDKSGNEITQYYSITNPISIFDFNNTTLQQTELDYRTNFGISLKVEDLDRKYGYYKVAVIQNSGINGEVSFFIEGVHPVSDDSVLYTTENQEARTTLNNLLVGKTVYTKSKGMANSNGYLFQYGLTAKKEMNLQPVVNLMGGFLKWQTSVAEETLYKDGVNNSLYKSFMRDEAYPFGIRFFTEEGFETARFPFIGRPPTAQELTVVETAGETASNDVKSLLEFGTNCIENTRNKYFQFYNTAVTEGVRPFDNTSDEFVTKEITKYCNISNVATIAPSTIVLKTDATYFGLEDYINKNGDAICDPSNVNYNATICNALNSAYPTFECTPVFGDNCNDVTLIEENNFIEEVVNEQTTKIEKDIDDYVKVFPPVGCNIYEVDPATGGKKRDAEFQSQYMAQPTQVAYDRVRTSANTSCSYSTELYFVDNPSGAVGNAYFLDYKGANTQAELQTDKNSTCVEQGFTNKVHEGGLWFRGEFREREEFIFEITKRSECDGEEDIPVGSKLRYTFFDTCNSTDPVYCQVVDMNQGAFIELNANQFASTSFYVVVDAPIVEETGNFETEPMASKFRTAPICGCFSAFLRDKEYVAVEVTYDAINLGKKQTYISNCDFAVPVFEGCAPIPFEYGKFSYVESSDEYPDNKELYDSSRLTIAPTDLPESIREEFEQYYTNTVLGEKYVMKADTNFACKPIRHFKFPDNSVAPFMTQDLINPFQRSLIYPMGVSLDKEVVNAFLDIAVKSGLISFEERKGIVKYEIVRGDRSANKSIVAKGLLYDTYKYDEKGKEVLYPNYPYNDLGSDILNYESDGRNSFIPHPFLGDANNRFTFHSPDTHFNKPTVPTEMSIEGFQYGNSRGVFADVDDHSKWVILGRDATTTATVLAVAEVALEIAIKLGELLVNAQTSNWFIGFAGVTNGFGTGVAGTSIGSGLAIGLGVAMGLQGFMKVGRYRYEWIEIFKANGQPKQFASFYSSHGYYNYFKPNNKVGDTVRGLATTKYLKAGRYSITEENTGKNFLFNNINRESSLYVSTGDSYPIEYPEDYSSFDNRSVDLNTNSRTTSSESQSCAKGRSTEIERNIASPYVALKNYLTNQYGDIDGVKWLTTGTTHDLRTGDELSTVFGGDTFISRFSFKRKVPFFLSNAMGLAPRTPFSYSEAKNIGTPRYFADYDVEQSVSLIGSLFPELGSDYNFDCLSGRNSFYVKPPSKFYLFYYGIPQFLVESEINVNYRYAKEGLENDFYPNYGDYVEYTQEKNVSIKEDNKFFYNNIYSKGTTFLGLRGLPPTYSKKEYDCLYDAPNGVIYSLQDSSEQDLSDPWLIYKNLDFYQFPTSAGGLIDLKGINSNQVLGRFENQYTVFNAVDVLRDRLNANTQELGTGGIFATRPSYIKTDLGYAGTQSKDMVSCEYGHFWADAKRGQVFQTDTNGQNPKEITVGLRNWFKEHLPFKFLRKNTESIGYDDLDNNFKGLGITMGWDSRYKRVFLTKKDYIPQIPVFTSCNKFYSVEERDALISQYEGDGFEYVGIDDCKLNFQKEGDVTLAEQTDIFAFFDATSMALPDAEDAAVALETWYNNYVVENPTFEGQLYIIPLLDENYLGYLSKINTGVIPPYTTGGWLNVANLPPNLNTVNWVPPTDVLLLAFVDETNPNYHSTTVASGFSGTTVQPSNSYIQDFINFKNVLPSFNSFKGVLYPIVRELTGQGGALVLQSLAAFKGRTLSQTEIDATGTTVNVSQLLTVNPYQNKVIPNTDPIEYLEPLEDLNWIGQFDKVSPASSVFSSNQFQDDLNRLVLNVNAEAPIEFTAVDLTELNLKDPSKFKDASFTLAYNPLTQSWISYYSFKPDYYVEYHNYFQTGLNYSVDPSEEGLWSHLLTNKSYNVFYGKKFDWTIELPAKETYTNNIMKTVEYWMDTKRFHNEFDFAEKRNIGFDKAWVYNNSVNSGQLDLITQQKNNQFQSLQYPKQKLQSREILASQNDKKWTFNSFYNVVRDELNNVPVWLNDVNYIDKKLNFKAVTYDQKWKDRLRGDWFLIRLTSSEDTRFKKIFKWKNSKQLMYN